MRADCNFFKSYTPTFWSNESNGDKGFKRTSIQRLFLNIQIAVI